MLTTITVLELSTGHVSEETARMLDTTSIMEWSVSGWLGVYGWIIRTEGYDPDTTPTDLQNCLIYAASQGARYIIFDRDCDRIDELPYFEW